MDFNLAVQKIPKAKMELKSDFGIRRWNSLDTEEKEMIFSQKKFLKI